MVLIIALTVVGVIAFFLRRTAVDITALANYRDLHVSLNQLIARRGIQDTLYVIENSFEKETITINECHSLLHQLGHAAYEFHSGQWEMLTMEKNHLCMDGFSHGVEAQMAMAWPQNPDRITNELRTYCQRMRANDPSWSCYHGAGHAFIQKYGNDVPAALAKCDEAVIPGDEAEDCYRGVFSEYRNFLNAYDGDNEAPIPGAQKVIIPTEKTFDICASLPNRYHDACISQFAGQLITDNLGASLTSCALFGSWVWHRCAQTVAGAFVANTFSQTNSIPLPKTLLLYDVEFRKGFLDGIYEGIAGFHLEDVVSRWKNYCARLPIAQDIPYCVSKVF